MSFGFLKSIDSTFGLWMMLLFIVELILLSFITNVRSSPDNQSTGHKKIFFAIVRLLYVALTICGLWYAADFAKSHNPKMNPIYVFMAAAAIGLPQVILRKKLDSASQLHKGLSQLEISELKAKERRSQKSGMILALSFLPFLISSFGILIFVINRFIPGADRPANEIPFMGLILVVGIGTSVSLAVVIWYQAMRALMNKKKLYELFHDSDAPMFVPGSRPANFFAPLNAKFQRWLRKSLKIDEVGED